MKISIISTGVILLLFCFACQNNVDNAKTEGTFADVQSGEQKDYKVAPDSAYTGKQQQPAPQRQPPDQVAEKQDWDRKIIKTATLSLEVENYKNYYSVLRESVKRTGGYIASENQQQSDYRLENTITIKVPVGEFEEAMNLLSAGTGKDKVVERKIMSQDVIGEVVDTKSRMEAKRQVRERYLELLKQAKNMEDILKVQEEINDVQEQIEMGMGRVGYLNHASAMSTINLTFYQILNPAAQEQPQDPSFFTRLWDAFKQGWGFIKNVIIGLITIWPLWLAVLAVWLGLRRWKLLRVKV